MSDAMNEIDNLISIWSIRPAPGSPEGKAWVEGARQGWRWQADEIERLRTALKPFADIARELTDAIRNEDKNMMAWAIPKVKDLRAALSAYEQTPENKDA